LADRVKSARTNSSVYGFGGVVDRVGTWAKRSNVVSRSEAIRLLIEKGLEK
jgi:hypothetical protein